MDEPHEAVVVENIVEKQGLRFGPFPGDLQWEADLFNGNFFSKILLVFIFIVI